MKRRQEKEAHGNTERETDRQIRRPTSQQETNMTDASALLADLTGRVDSGDVEGGKAVLANLKQLA